MPPSVNAGQHVEDSGFAGTIGSDQAHQAAFFDGHGKIINGPQTAEGNTESGYFESCHISLPPFRLFFSQSVFPSVR